MLKNIKGIFSEETEILETTELDSTQELDESFSIDESNKKRSNKAIVKVYEPVTKSVSSTIIDSIKRGELCIVNFSKVSEEEARVIYSTLSGSVYSLDGVLKMVSNDIMVCAPKNFLIDGDATE